MTLAVAFSASILGSICVTMTGFGFLLTFLMFYNLLGGSAQLTGVDKQWLVYELGQLSAAAMVVADWQLISWRWVRYVTLPSVIAAPLGVLAANRLGTTTLMRVMAAVFLVAASQQLWDVWTQQRRELVINTIPVAADAADEDTVASMEFDPAATRRGPPRLPASTAELASAGALAGFMGGLCAMPGPPIKVLCVLRPLPPDASLRGTVSTFFVSVHALNLITMAAAHQAALGSIVARTLPSSFFALSGLALGAIVGHLLRRLQPDPHKVNLAIIALLFLSCADLAAGAPEEAPVRWSTRLALLAFEAVYVSALRVAFVRLHPTQPPQAAPTASTYGRSCWRSNSFTTALVARMHSWRCCSA